MSNQGPFREFPIESIERIAAWASCVSGLLAVLHILPEAERLQHLQTCSLIANDVARDLAELIGGRHV
jgi:hypothetical protein